ncbi:MAG TPA: homoserine O-acetyltransferase [Crinalium sp.]
MTYQHLISPHTQFYHLPEPFQLESGQMLLNVQVAYRTWGQLNAAGDNAVLVCHALTGGADLDDWWAPLLGAGRSLDPAQDFIVCSNILGSCYGTTGPISLNPETGKPYGVSFPAITIRDMVHLQAKLLETLGVQSIRLAIGGSLGGMQVLEWALLYPERVQAIAPIAAPGRHSAWCIGLSETQRQAIFADPNWKDGNYTPDQPPSQGLAIARMLAMITYRSWNSFTERFGRQYHGDGSGQPSLPGGQPFAIANYLQYQGEKLVNRFDANSYVILTHAMDSHDVGRDRAGYEPVLQNLPHLALVVAIDSDVLYPPVEQQELASLMPNAQLAWLNSTHGHDAFLIDMDALNHLVLRFRHHLTPASPHPNVLLLG